MTVLDTILVLWVCWRLNRIWNQWLDERAEKRARGVMLPIQPYSHRHTNSRRGKPWQRPRH